MLSDVGFLSFSDSLLVFTTAVQFSRAMSPTLWGKKNNLLKLYRVNTNDMAYKKTVVMSFCQRCCKGFFCHKTMVCYSVFSRCGNVLDKDAIFE